MQLVYSIKPRRLHTLVGISQPHWDLKHYGDLKTVNIWVSEERPFEVVEPTPDGHLQCRNYTMNHR